MRAAAVACQSIFTSLGSRNFRLWCPACGETNQRILQSAVRDWPTSLLAAPTRDWPGRRGLGGTRGTNHHHSVTHPPPLSPNPPPETLLGAAENAYTLYHRSILRGIWPSGCRKASQSGHFSKAELSSATNRRTPFMLSSQISSTS